MLPVAHVLGFWTTSKNQDAAGALVVVDQDQHGFNKSLAHRSRDLDKKGSKEPSVQEDTKFSDYTTEEQLLDQFSMRLSLSLCQHDLEVYRTINNSRTQVLSIQDRKEKESPHKKGKNGERSSMHCPLRNINKRVILGNQIPISLSLTLDLQ